MTMARVQSKHAHVGVMWCALAGSIKAVLISIQVLPWLIISAGYYVKYGVLIAFLCGLNGGHGTGRTFRVNIMYMYEEKDVQGVQGRAGRGGVSIAKMYILVHLKCSPHAIPHADIKGAWRRPYWPCMTFQHTGAAPPGRPPFYGPTRTRSIFNAWKCSACRVTTNGTWQNFRSVLQTFSKSTYAPPPVVKSRRENLYASQLDRRSQHLATAVTQTRLERQNQKWWRLGTLVMAQIKIIKTLETIGFHGFNIF